MPNISDSFGSFDLTIEDSNKNAIVGLNDGHIITRNFSSKSIIKTVENHELRISNIESAVGFHPCTFSVLGDSLSTFAGWIPQGYATWYPRPNPQTNNVQSYEQCWWAIFAREYHCRLLKLNSWSGSPVSYDGYGTGQTDAKDNGSAFILRTSKELLGEPELIIVNGGTNDSSISGENPGNYVYENWTEDDLKYFRPAFAKLLHDLKEIHLGATILVTQNTGLRTGIAESFAPICEHYDVPLLVMHDLSKQDGHYDINGMRAVAD